MTESITTENGTEVGLRYVGKSTVVVLSRADAPATEAGRIEGGGFQPVPFAEFGMRPDVLRAIADLIEGRG